MIALRWLLLLIAVISPAWDGPALARTAEECRAEFKAADLDNDATLDEAEIASARNLPAPACGPNERAARRVRGSVRGGGFAG
jgi:hypothetical protein